MKRVACWFLMLVWVVVAATPVVAARNMQEDASADPALLTLSDPAGWRVGLAYASLTRPVVLDGVEWNLRGQIADATLGYSPWPWLWLYGQVGGSEARLDQAMANDASFGAGGLLGARLNLWELYEGVQVTAWRVTLGLAGQYAYRTADDDGSGELQWSETLVMLPLEYHLTFARNFRNVYMAEFHSFSLYAGPAYSKLDGTWTRGGVEQEFEEAQSFGVVGGVELWLLENLSFGVRADWFDHTTAQLTVCYRF